MKKILLPLLMIFSIGASAQLAPQDPRVTQEVVTSTDLCAKIAQFIPSLVNNKLSGKTKDEQLAHMESRFKEVPHAKMWEPALNIMLDALYDTVPGNAISVENIKETGPQFLRATIIACLREEAKGWIQEVPGVVEFERTEITEPGDIPQETPTPAPRFKKPSMSKEISI